MPLVGHAKVQSAGKPHACQQQYQHEYPIEPADGSGSAFDGNQHQGLATWASHASDLNQ
ncbi:hypothetical protein AERO9A_340179 [Aeromonas salmonicida]|nr:hypothetical protein AERO9A_340179 [Aeromonas salmonicida]